VAQQFQQLRISVVIPALNEQEGIHRALQSSREPGVERIVVDGGSRDGTSQVARFLKADKLIASPPGRARQLDAGYRAATGEVVLFLHADTRLEPGWSDSVRRALERPRVAGGAFRQRFDSERWGYRVLEFGTRLRSRGGLPCGDQALFVRRHLLDARGGIPDTPIFEDLDLARWIRDYGKLALCRQRAVTSPRRYEANGLVRGLGRKFVALFGYLVDFDRERVARWYHRKPRE